MVHAVQPAVQMRRVLVSISLLFPAVAVAQPGATEPGAARPPSPATAAPMGPDATAPLQPNDPQTPLLARSAHNAAARGDCIGAAALGARIYRVDPVYHQAPDRHDAIVHQRLLPRGRSTIGSCPRVAKLADASITRELATVDGRTREGDKIFSATRALRMIGRVGCWRTERAICCNAAFVRCWRHERVESVRDERVVSIRLDRTSVVTLERAKRGVREGRRL
ncbi:MAG: hypothetical protein JWP01_711 [Myxococcales bacterium]|nr:hypothetical protein [Myxococcales bacterium]